MSDRYTRITVPLSKDEFEALRDSAAANNRHPREQAQHIIHMALLTERPLKLEHITTAPTVEDFNALIDCINALSEMVTA